MRQRIQAEIDQRPDMTIRKLSLDAGMSDSALHKFMTGQTKSLTVDNLEKIAEALGISVRNLWFGAAEGEDDKLTYLWDHIAKKDRNRVLRVLEGFVDKKDRA